MLFVFLSLFLKNKVIYKKRKKAEYHFLLAEAFLGTVVNKTCRAYINSNLK